jgi:hypothetical protein
MHDSTQPGPCGHNEAMQGRSIGELMNRVARGLRFYFVLSFTPAKTRQETPTRSL